MQVYDRVACSVLKIEIFVDICAERGVIGRKGEL